MEPELDEIIVKKILKLQKKAKHSYGAKNYLVSQGIEKEWHDTYFSAAEELMEKNLKKPLPFIIGIGILINAVIIYFIYDLFSTSQLGNPYYSDIKSGINAMVIQLVPFVSIISGLLAATGIKNKTAFVARLITVAAAISVVGYLLFLLYLYGEAY